MRMPVDVDIARFLAALPASSGGTSLEEMRHATERDLPALHGPLQEVAAVRMFSVTADDGHEIRIRGYWPTESRQADAPLPAIVFVHGGGWVLCSLALYDNPCRALANATGCVVLSVDYRLAPEHKFPVPLEDVYRAVAWAFDQAAELGIDPKRIAVGGDSAGGNLAAAATLLARDRNGPAIAHQLLLYPALDSAMDSPSYGEFAEGYYLTRDVMAFCWSAYLSGPADKGSPYASPLRAGRLGGLPPATILVCEYDPLRDEGEAYALRLADAGVIVQQNRLPGMVHACIHLLGVAPAAECLFDRVGAMMRAALRA
ncbi:alpha/beta hydrolase [Cupriavidus basilensis]|uniref:alpha/beta hydrolase n=1 Tax=Cupriavidus basilensis TaxID=68895 RepID=UPI0023E8F783|nr:alpha/beta hydrolase [Cupriavidus basilensis]MDF3885674.1 alpha/beta hydrolase [Cupriavidus basilensis]